MHTWPDRPELVAGGVLPFGPDDKPGWPRRVERAELVAALLELDDDAQDVGAVIGYALRRLLRGSRHSGASAADATP